MQNLDELAKYVCDKVGSTLKAYGRTVQRTGDHSLIVSCQPYETITRTRVVVRRTGQIEVEPLHPHAKNNPIPNLQDHIADALAGEYDYTSRKSGDCVVMQPRALSKAPYALPAST